MGQWVTDTPTWFKNLLLIILTSVVVGLAGGYIQDEARQKEKIDSVVTDHDKRIYILESRWAVLDTTLRFIMDSTGRIESDMKEHLRQTRQTPPK